MVKVKIIFKPAVFVLKPFHYYRYTNRYTKARHWHVLLIDRHIADRISVCKCLAEKKIVVCIAC